MVYTEAGVGCYARIFSKQQEYGERHGLYYLKDTAKQAVFVAALFFAYLLTKT